MTTKEELRKSCYRSRSAIENPERESDKAIALLLGVLANLSQSNQRIQNQLWYVSCRSELQTHRALNGMFNSGDSFENPKISVPFCQTVDHVNQLMLFQVNSLKELERGTWNILEPSSDIRALQDRKVEPSDIDVAVVPAVAFDREGNRLGNGAGYYDWLLKRLRPEAVRIGLAFSCQIVEKVPAMEHDQRVDWVVSEKEIICCRESVDLI